MRGGGGRELLRYQSGRDERERLAVYGTEVCGELFNEAIRLDGVTGDRGVGGAAFQRSRQRRSAGGRQSDPHDGAVAERVGALFPRIKSPDPNLSRALEMKTTGIELKENTIQSRIADLIFFPHRITLSARASRFQSTRLGQGYFSFRQPESHVHVAVKCSSFAQFTRCCLRRRGS